MSISFGRLVFPALLCLFDCLCLTLHVLWITLFSKYFIWMSMPQHSCLIAVRDGYIKYILFLI